MLKVKIISDLKIQDYESQIKSFYCDIALVI